ncbi:MAG: PilN domain-containing protein [Anaerohalosphaera sp.]|nr:PilN domain-containing protein [Anaerohalosphaera sp.]
MNSVRKHDGNDPVIAVSCSWAVYLPLRAVKMRKNAGRFELLWEKTSAGQSDNLSFVKNIVAEESSGGSSIASSSVVVSFDSAPVAFYRIEVPPVEDSKLGPIVQMQIEALLPAVPVQMRTDWFAHPDSHGKRVVTVAVAREDRLRSAVPVAQTSDASAILLDCQAVTKAWCELFDHTDKPTVLINIRDKSIQLLLVENCQMANAMMLDIDMANLSDPDEFETHTELFVHDLRGALTHLGLDERDVDVRLLSPEEQTHQQLIEYLKVSGINVSSSVPDTNLMAGPLAVEAAEICDNLDIIGAAMLALDPHETRLNIFKDLYTSSQDKKPVRKSVPLVRLAVIVLVMLFLCGFAAKALDKAELEKLRNADAAELLARENTRKTIAQQRADILKIMDKINKSKPQGMLLNSFSYKNNTVTISSHANSFEQYQEFQKKLQSQSGFSNVKGQNPVKDEKTQRIAFKITFACKGI